MQHQPASNAGSQQAAGTQSGIDKSAMDKSVKPGDDFNEYANGTWQKNAQIPADKSNISVFSIDQRSGREARRGPGQGHRQVEPDSGDDARIANYYKAYTDTNGIEQRGRRADQG